MWTNKVYFLVILLEIISGCSSPKDKNSEKLLVPKGEDTVSMVLIPAGEFIMGTNEQQWVYPNESSPSGISGFYYSSSNPLHKVYLDSFLIDKYEVTNARYKKFCDVTGKPYPLNPYWDENYFLGKPNYPVINIGWKEANDYAVWVGKRLPTEAEWEKAARGIDGRQWVWGNKPTTEIGSKKFIKWFKNKCNFSDGKEDGSMDGYKYTAPLGCFPFDKSPYGVMDMAGNVLEWCSDFYDENYYKTGPDSNPKNIQPNWCYVTRGGAWNHPIAYARCYTREGHSSVKRYYYIGFRCAKSITK
ncbi:MAG: formylglycine-generating enzyme family protein [Candidatus Edwardsbacteria bacterium]